MAAKTRSVARVASKTLRADKKARDAAAKGKMPAVDSFVNFAQKMGIGADNPLTSGSYGFNPITRQRILLEWIHRGSWLGGVAVDLLADDMTKMGIEIQSELDPDSIKTIHEAATTLQIWPKINETIKWSRLYGGAVGYMMVDGQDPKTPLRLETIGKGQFKGIYPLDRWMVEPSMSQLVTEMGPEMGLPKYYRVVADAPALPRVTIHHSRVLRLEGIRLPYYQRLMENMWGISVLERLYDRMISFDSATTGAAQLVYKAYIRTYAIEGMRDIVAAGGPALNGLVQYIEMMRRFQGIEGITLLDSKDKMEAMQHGAFSGLSDALLQFGQQLSGALQIPLVRLFGQSPAGLNSSGESDLRTYYDNIKQQQEKDLRIPITRIYKALAKSEGIPLSEGSRIEFSSLWQLSDKEKSDIAESTTRAVTQAEEAGLITQKGAMKELQQSSKITGIFSNITDDDIESAEESLPPAGAEAAQLALEASSSSSGEEGENGEEAPAGDQPPEKKPPTKDSIAKVVGTMKRVHDLDVAIENPKGSIRRGVGWETVMPYDYGYIRRTTAPDDAEVDCCIGPDLESPFVWVIDQVNLETRAPDEPKVMLGYKDTHSALSAYVAGYSDSRGLDRIGGLHSMSMDQFKDWLKQYPDTRFGGK